MATKAKQVHVTATLDEAQEGCNGGCIACGELQTGGVEPDARNYPCESCGANEVFGLEELVVMGLLDIDGEEE